MAGLDSNLELDKSETSTSALLDSTLDLDNPENIYTNLFNINSSIALVAALIVTFTFSADAATLDLEGKNVCQEYNTWVENTQGTWKGFKHDDGDEDGCELGCNNIWKTCHLTHIMKWAYECCLTLATVSCFTTIGLATNMIITASKIPHSQIKKFKKDLGWWMYASQRSQDTVWIFVSFAVFLQASLVFPPITLLVVFLIAGVPGIFLGIGVNLKISSFMTKMHDSNQTMSRDSEDE